MTNDAMSLLAPELFIPYALIQSVLFLLLIRFLDLYEREPLTILALMAAWGAVGATTLSMFGNGIVSGIVSRLSPEVELVFGPAISAPLVEEISKGAALVAAFVLSYLAARRFGGLEFSGITDGIVYGAAVGLGFAFAEDILYLLKTTYEEDLLEGLEVYQARVDFFGPGQLGHAVYTGTFGAGLGLATWSRSWILKGLFSMVGLGAAMLMHAIHNGLAELILVLRFGLADTAAALSGESLPVDLVQQMESTLAVGYFLVTVFDYAIVVAFFLLVGLWLFYQQRVIRSELAEEVNTGLISQQEWEIMPRYWRRSRWYWQVLWSGKVEQWRVLRRVHNELVDLAFLKWRLRRMGGDWDRVERLRGRIRMLKSQEIIEGG